MFSKISRYYKVPDVAVPDPQGRVLASKDLRLLPTVTGTFRHTVQAGDRLDHLSHKYYSQPLQWWHICDANPEFLSPLALLGDEVIVTTRFPLTISSGGVPPWGILFRTLHSVLGVENIQVIEDVELVLEEKKIGNQTVPVFEDRYHWEVRVVYNRLNVTPETLIKRIEEIEGDLFKVTAPAEIGQLGQQIIVPPKVIG